MIEGSRAFVVGVTAAVKSARAIESGLPTLLAWPDSSTSQATANDRVDRSIRTAYRTLRLLSRIPGSHWKNTCLFRSVAECVVRREYGVAARVVIGVDSMDGDVVAHSWVEQAGAQPHDSRDMEPLHPARRSAVVG